MKPELETLKVRLETDNEAPLTTAEIAYLEQIKTADDLTNHDGSELMKAISYDAALVLGLSETKAMIVAGDIPADSEQEIEVYYRDGEYLSGHTLHGDDAKFLESIGLAKYVDGWGYLVSEKTVNSLGQKFTRHAARELAQPVLEAKRQHKNAEDAIRASVFSEAKRSNRPAILDQYTAECNDPREECSLDNVTVYAMPDGSTKITRSHTW